MRNISNKLKIYFVAGITLFGLGGLGLLLNYLFFDRPANHLFIHAHKTISFQLLAGFIYGCIASFLLLFVLQKKFLTGVTVFFGELFKKYNVSYTDIFFLSICAGVGEEILFRGVVQEWMGVWLTAILFIVLHGYLNPKNKPLFIYGMILLLVSAGFGYMMNYFGLWSAITAHSIIDIFLMIYLRRRKSYAQ